MLMLPEQTVGDVSEVDLLTLNLDMGYQRTDLLGRPVFSKLQ